MGNKTNSENWAASERLTSIERSLWWRGYVGRPDLAHVFGISAAQASSDLQKYLEINPGAMTYHLSRKRYIASPTMKCILHKPRLEEAITAFMEDEGVVAPFPKSVGSSDCVAFVTPPLRNVAERVERAAFIAVSTSSKLKIKYYSVNSGTAKFRTIAPHAFGHDGMRWHLRAWCFENGDFRDFVLGRISEAKWPEPLTGEEDIPQDLAWDTIEQLRYELSPTLTEEQRAALILDYGLPKNGVLKIKSRQAMAQYVDAQLRIQVEGGYPTHFVRA